MATAGRPRGARTGPSSLRPLWRRPPSSPPRPRTSPAGTRTSWPRPSWPTTARCGARWSSAPTATPSGSGCRPRSTCASRPPAPTTATSRSSSPRATCTVRPSTSRASPRSSPSSPMPAARSSRSRVVVRPTSETIFNDLLRQVGAELPRPAAAAQPVGQRRALGAAPPPVPAHHRVPLAGGPHLPRHPGRRRGLRRADPARGLRRLHGERARHARADRAQDGQASASPAPSTPSPARP